MLINAKQFKAQPEEHIEAVKQFRLPFWDYFRPRGGNCRFPGVRDLKRGTTGYEWDFSIPNILEVETVMVYKPSGKNDLPEKEFQLQEIDNPLNKFKFPEDNSIKDEEWAALEAEKDGPFKGSKLFTTRHDTLLVGKSNYQQLNTVLAQRRESEVEALLNLLNPKMAYTDYKNFATKAIPKDWKNKVYASVESLHDDYHGICGG